MKVSVTNRRTCNEDHIPSGLDLGHPQPNRLAHSTFDPIAHDSPTNPTADRKSEAAIGELVGQPGEHQKALTQRTTAPPNLLKPSAATHSIETLHPKSTTRSRANPGKGKAQRIDLRVERVTANCLRPRRRRRLITFRPPADRIRLRKPWVRSRFRVLGCQVRLGIQLLLEKHQSVQTAE